MAGPSDVKRGLGSIAGASPVMAAPEAAGKIGEMVQRGVAAAKPYVDRAEKGLREGYASLTGTRDPRPKQGSRGDVMLKSRSKGRSIRGRR